MKRAVLSTRDRKDGAFGEDEEAAADDGMESGESEREETQPAAPGDLLWLQEDTQTPVQRRRKKKKKSANRCRASTRLNSVYSAMK